jgi:hypothetical protein
VKRTRQVFQNGELVEETSYEMREEVVRRRAAIQKVAELREKGRENWKRSDIADGLEALMELLL